MPETQYLAAPSICLNFPRMCGFSIGQNCIVWVPLITRGMHPDYSGGYLVTFSQSGVENRNSGQSRGPANLGIADLILQGRGRGGEETYQCSR